MKKNWILYVFLIFGIFYNVCNRKYYEYETKQDTTKQNK